MALVTVQRSPSVSSSPQSSDSGAGGPADDDEAARSCIKSLSECYFAGKGAALVLPPNERARPSRRVSAAGCDIQQHLQSMFYLLRPEETLKMAVKLESVHPGRTRYLVVVSCTGRQDAEESCLLGIDFNVRATVGLVLRVLADTAITLDGDGGFSVSVCGRQHIFKPVSVQAMWSALQTLHKVSSKAREQNYFLNGLSHDWVNYYERRIESDRSCLNEWHAMDNLESRRPPSPDSVRNKPRERDETERVIRSTLKEIMMSVDLDEVTSKYIRGRLEEDLDMDLVEFKPFIDQEMLTILGQMDSPTEIFDHVYLGSEWNASNLEELQKNGVRHILNVTREIDNFFPGMFNYLNVRVYDDEKTDLLKHWDDTFKYITKARKEGSKVLVHCKMGVSRSASVVIAYAMKAYNWNFSQALKHVKNKRNCIKPNSSFLIQLETYQGILAAMKNKEKLQRSKSETNLVSPTLVKDREEEEEILENDDIGLSEETGLELMKTGKRPKSWSPNIEVPEDTLRTAPLSQSLESIDKSANPEVTREDLLRSANPKTDSMQQEGRNVLMPCDNGQSYSVSQNQIFHLPGPDSPSTVKNRINELENQSQKRKGLVLNLTNQFEAVNSKPSSPSDSNSPSPILENGETCLVWTASTEVKNLPPSLPEPSTVPTITATVSTSTSTTTTSIPQRNKPKREGDLFSAHLDHVFDREERRRSPNRQSSWNSYDSAVIMNNNSSVNNNCVTLPSRNSSWGSYDVRPSLTSTGNSVVTVAKTVTENLGSSGLFPYDREEIPWHPGTVKRTKQKLEENTQGGGTSKRVCTQSSESENEIDSSAQEKDSSVTNHSQTLPIESNVKQSHKKQQKHQNVANRLSSSAPASSSMTEVPSQLVLRSCRSESETSGTTAVDTPQYPSVKHHKMVLENLCSASNKTKLSTDDSPEVDSPPRGTSGIVKNLKREFEAKSTSKQFSTENRSPDAEENNARPTRRDAKVRSLPSSPVIGHSELRACPEDLSVKVLVGKYEPQKVRPQQKQRNNRFRDSEAIEHPPARAKIAPDFVRRSKPVKIFTAKSTEQYQRTEAPGRPNSVVTVPTPGVVVASVVAKAASKKQQQHGRTHPLARLQVRPRHSSPVYNTM